ncbi:tetratricopeptide repeat protein [Sphingobacterium lactis]|uniref:tetratricopeptide repeat protein n=1 Tax=Sphingobacterium lactis TaxID=797291 RepID=UPI003F7F2CC9
MSSIKYFILSLITFFNLATYGQELKFDKKFYDALDKWVVIEGIGNPPKHVLGFIYLDPSAGISFRHESHLFVLNDKLVKDSVNKEAMITARLSEGLADIAVLSDLQIQTLGLPKEPNWLSVYKVNEGTSAYQVSKGLWLNSVNASHLALPILKAVYEKEPKASGLQFELAYAYNHVGSFYKAIVILNKAIEDEPNNFWYYRELGFALKHLNNLKEADKAYKLGIKHSNDKMQNAEMSINMLQSYFQVKDRPKFDEWKGIFLKHVEEGSQFLEYLKFFEDNWEMERK